MEAITSPEGNAVFNNYNISVSRVWPTGRVSCDLLLDMTGIADPELKPSIPTHGANAMSSQLLRIEGLNKHYGAQHVL